MPVTDRVLHPGELLFSEGNMDDNIYIIKKGKLEIMSRNPLYILDGNMKVAGDLLGVITALCNMSHVYSVRSVDDSIVTCCHLDEFSSLVRNKPHIALKIVSGLSSVVRLLNGRIMKNINTDKKNEDERLFEIGIYFFEKKDYKKAEYVFHKCEQIYGMNKSIAEKSLFKLGEIYENMNEKEKAINIYQRLVDRYPLDKRVTRVCQTIVSRLKSDLTPEMPETDVSGSTQKKTGLLSLIKSASKGKKE